MGMITKVNASGDFPDIRDGLTRKERIVLDCLNEMKRERGDRHVPAVMLYGRVVEKIDMSPDEMQSILQRLAGEG